MSRRSEENKLSKIALYKMLGDFDASLIKQQYQLINHGMENGWSYFIYTKTSLPQLPTWLPLIKNLVDVNKIGKNIYSSLIILFKKDDSQFALTAGYGYADIHDHAIQDYGIDISLRAADPHGLKTLIQKIPIGNIFSFNRVLRGKYIPESDKINKKSVLRQIAGECHDIRIGRSICGTTSLVISGKKNFVEVVSLLDLLLETETKEPSVKISGLKQAPKDIHQDLDAKLIDKIKNSIFDDIFLCYGDERIQLACDRVKIGKQLIAFDDADSILKEALKLNSDNPQNISLLGMDENGQKLHTQKKKIMDLLEGEINYNNSVYFRVNKKWYQANQEVIEETEKEFLQINHIEVPYLKDWLVKNGKPEEEDEFLERIFNDNKDLVQAHRKKLLSGNIEFSDIYDPGRKDIIHVKKGRGAFLRCLFSQSYVSGKLFAGDEGFRKEAETKLGINVSNPSENKIILAIFNPNQKKSPFTLFAKVDLVERISALKENGYTVGYCLITPKYEN